MSNSFQDTLATIKDQEADFDSMDERAVDIGLVIPLLMQLGWNTHIIKEIYPQRLFDDGTRVDYDLRIDGESRVLIEVKSWKHTLNEGNEDQLEGYCKQAKPIFAVLTNGHDWRLYLSPNCKSKGLMRFREFEITEMDPNEAEGLFKRFLARARMSNPKLAEDDALKLYKKSQAFENFSRALTEAWAELVKDKHAQAVLLLEFAEKKGIAANQDNVLRFLNSIDSSLVNEVPTDADKSQKKPATFSLPFEPLYKTKNVNTVTGNKGWNTLLAQICLLMEERHPDNFRENVLSIPNRFAEAEDPNFNKPLGDTGIFAKSGFVAAAIKKDCYMVVTSFGYPKDSLEIRDSNGAIL